MHRSRNTPQTGRAPGDASRDRPLRILADPSGSAGRWRFALGAGVSLAAVIAVLYHDVLRGGWRFDDGTHLLFATKFAPWEYFFVPSVTHRQSAHVTPWNVFFYDVNLALFGFAPRGFYAHQLLVLWLTALATVALLRCWVERAPALFGAVLFVVGAPTAYVANALMCGHYAAGLLFSATALLSFVQAVRTGKRRYAASGAVCYLLAVTCKEVYAPLPGVLPFLPVATVRARVRALWPYVPVALGYALWRRAVLGEFLGGYQPEPSFAPAVAAKLLRRLPERLLGPGLLGAAALAALAGLVISAAKRRRLRVGLVLVALALVVAPLMPTKGSLAAERYLFAAWWVASLGAAALLGQLGGGRTELVRTALALVIAAAALDVAASERVALERAAAAFEETAAFALDGPPDSALVPPDDYDPQVIRAASDLVAAADRHGGARPRPRVLAGEDELAAVDLATARVYRYDAESRSVRDVTGEVPRLLAEFESAQLDRPLSYRIGRRGAELVWEFGPYAEGEYYLEVEGTGLMGIARRGRIGVERVRRLGRVRYVSPDGWMTRSPPIDADPRAITVLEWSRP